MYSWKRSHDFGGNTSTSFDHNTILKIENFLKERSECKLAKKYSRADEISTILKDMNICYHDDKKEWYYKAPSKKSTDTSTSIFHPGSGSVGNRSEIVSDRLISAKKKERNRRQAEKNRKKKRVEVEGGDVEEKVDTKKRKKL